MSPTEKIAKLERLLARVNERAEAPRASGAAAFQPPAARVVASAHATPAPEPVVHLTPTAPPWGVESTMAAHLSSEPPPLDASSGWTELPPPTSADPVFEPADLVLEADDADVEIDADAEVDVSAEVVEVDVDVDESGVVPVESGAHLVAEQATNGVHEAEIELLVPADAIADPTVPPPAAEPRMESSEPPPATEPPAANEVLEPAPSSSPRPIVSEKPEAYEESAPLHTPPPESGKQVAGPSVKPAALHVSSLPPPSLNDHTLIGGWREPGIGLPRAPGADATRPSAVRVPPAHDAVEAASSASPPRLVAEVTAPELRADAPVATIEGAPPRFTPASFGELLDATLSL